jgi:molybdopterin molybdotransferase
MGSPGVLAHGVNVRPGKPTILAVCEGKPVIGLPGNPVSALVIAGIFVTPSDLAAVGYFYTSSAAGCYCPAGDQSALSSRTRGLDPGDFKSWSRGYQADPIFFKSNLIFTLAQADGLAYIPADATGRSAGEEIEVFLLQ